MKVWFVIPSARPQDEANANLRKWKDKGYGIALWRDTDIDVPCCNLLLTGEYPGYATSVNVLAGEVLRRDPDCSWIVTGGDDMWPDPNLSPGEIAQQCTEHFAGTFGVMQPTGDRWGDAGGAYADRVAGSPWMGRKFCETMYGGDGPMWHEYRHMFPDAELQCVATSLGVFWQRPDLSHYHDHWQRNQGAKPEFMEQPTSPQHWQKYGDLFRSRKSHGFPGHEPLSL